MQYTPETHIDRFHGAGIDVNCDRTICVPETSRLALRRLPQEGPQAPLCGFFAPDFERFDSQQVGVPDLTVEAANFHP